MGDRAYLSIGEVLSLLKDEFPDITISKIRFLESQGLLDPERTASGYRKFYEPDVERLRWILRQQREHFLPLKVIKGRLGVRSADDAADDDVPADETAVAAPGPGPVAAGVTAPAPPAPERPAVFAASATAPVAAPAAPAPAPRAASAPASPQPARPWRPAAPSQPAAPVPGPTAPSQPAGPVPVPASAPPPPLPATGLPPPLTPPPRPAPAGGPAHTGTGTGTSLSAGVSGVSLTMEELASATGLPYDRLRELERYGFIAGRPVAGTVYYDEESLVVANLAVGFARFGIEGRHLRIYKNSAEREAGLFEQIVTPLLKQRNPEARRQAVESLEELTRLGQSLRAAVLRQSLRRLSGG